MATTITVKELKESFAGKLERHFGRNVNDCTKQQAFKATALVLRDIMASRLLEAQSSAKRAGRELHYLSLEFLLGRSLGKNAFNLGVSAPLQQAIEELIEERRAATNDKSLDNWAFSEFLETEPDAGLGNGGLGRLAACYLDSMTTLGLPATGYTICYEHGMFKQKIFDGEQVEMPDLWLDVSDVWLLPRVDEAVTVKFGGRLEEHWEDGVRVYEHVDCAEVLAIPKDMLVSGYGTEHVNRLRLWDAKAVSTLDYKLFSSGQYLKAMEQAAMAQVIAKVLYPEDNHFEGKLLRLRQQYFFVSATVQSIVAGHRKKYGSLKDFHLRHVLHINDTHPTLVIPELMRILLDEEKMEWDEAWMIVRHAVAYTNHTVLSEALERWPQNIVELLLPRVWQILCEINSRYIQLLTHDNKDQYTISQMAVIWDGEVRMANLCAYACYAVNGVSALHSSILVNDIFKLQYSRESFKFLNITNGVDHRRWLAQVNPGLHELLCETIGDGYLADAKQLANFRKFENDESVLKRLAEIKRANKLRLARRVDKEMYLRHLDIKVNPDSIFDVQAKRLHEYKRQLLNVLQILRLYNFIKDNPNADMAPRTFFFGAKAASGYYMAKRIIRLINAVSGMISRDPAMKDKLSVIFLENYRVSVAEVLIPAAEISEQISIAGKEASGTGNMKFMMNGALTVGTMDGANVEINEFVGRDHIFIFGLLTDEVEKLKREGYSSSAIYSANEELRRVLDMISAGFGSGGFDDIVKSLLLGDHGNNADTYMLLADFESYCNIHDAADKKYREPLAWNRSSLHNIAASGAFAADRSISQYNEHIWSV